MKDNSSRKKLVRIQGVRLYDPDRSGNNPPTSSTGRCSSSREKVAAVTRPCSTATSRAALHIFKEKHIVRVPITAGNKLEGILSRVDALRGILEEPEFLMF